MRKKDFIKIFEEYFNIRKEFIKAHDFIRQVFKCFKDTDYDVMKYLDHNLVEINEEKLLKLLINDFSYIFDD